MEAERFAYHPTRVFAERLQALEHTDPVGHRHARRTMERLLLNREASDGTMTGPHHGKLKKYAGRSGYRLIYNWCLSCRRANQHQRIACEACGAIADHSVVFLDLFHKSDHHKLGY